MRESARKNPNVKITAIPEFLHKTEKNSAIDIPAINGNMMIRVARNRLFHKSPLEIIIYVPSNNHEKSPEKNPRIRLTTSAVRVKPIPRTTWAKHFPVK